MNLRQITTRLGITADFRLDTESDYEAARARWKELTAAARLAGDDNRAAELSQVKEALKKLWNAKNDRVCPRCGNGKSPHAQYCQVCRGTVNNNGYVEERNNTVECKIESGVLVPEITRHGELTQTLRKLELGQSFVTGKSMSSIGNIARTSGIKVICRRENPAEKDPKKRLIRVWRCDGLTAEELNQRITA